MKRCSNCTADLEQAGMTKIGSRIFCGSCGRLSEQVSDEPVSPADVDRLRKQARRQPPASGREQRPL